MRQPSRKPRPVLYQNRQQIDRTVYNKAKNWLLKALREDLKEHPEFATEASMFASSVESMGVPRHMTKHFFQTLVDSGDLIPHPLGGLMINGGKSPSKAEVIANIPATLQKLKTAILKAEEKGR